MRSHALRAIIMNTGAAIMIININARNESIIE
jgi:hypothetical protein